MAHQSSIVLKHTMRHFGPNRGVMSEAFEQTELPKELPKCIYCEEDILRFESGFILPYVTENEKAYYAYKHEECFLRGVLGSLGHMQRNCSCYGGSEEDPIDMSKRQAALAAVNFFYNGSAGVNNDQEVSEASTS